MTYSAFQKVGGRVGALTVLLLAACTPTAAPPAAAPTQAVSPAKPTTPAAPPTAAAAATSQQAAAPGEVYRVGLSGVQTGPNASTYAPSQEGIKAYLDRVNERGGINGRKIEVTYLDNRGEPPRAIADTKRLVDDDRVLLLVNNAPSSTYAPMVQAAKESKVPLLFAGSAVCPQQVFPPNPDPYLFCASFNMLEPDAKAITAALGDLNKTLGGSGAMKVGLAALDIPVSRQGVDLIEKSLGPAGMQATEKIVVPVGTADYSPFATRVIGAGTTWMTHWAPFDVGTGMFTALTRQGWKGYYLATASPLAEVDTVRFAQPNFLVIPTYSFSVEGLPVFKEVEDAVKKSGGTYPPEGTVIGWVGGQVIEAALTQCGWPCDREKLRGAMERVNVDTKGLFGGPVDWSANNHVRSAAYYRVYRWDEAQKKIVRVRDWLKVDI